MANIVKIFWFSNNIPYGSFIVEDKNSSINISLVVLPLFLSNICWFNLEYISRRFDKNY